MPCLSGLTYYIRNGLIFVFVFYGTSHFTYSPSKDFLRGHYVFPQLPLTMEGLETRHHWKQGPMPARALALRGSLHPIMPCLLGLTYYIKHNLIFSFSLDISLYAISLRRLSHKASCFPTTLAHHGRPRCRHLQRHESFQKTGPYIYMRYGPWDKTSLETRSPAHLGPVYTTVKKSIGH